MKTEGAKRNASVLSSPSLMTDALDNTIIKQLAAHMKACRERCTTFANPFASEGPSIVDEDGASSLLLRVDRSAYEKYIKRIGTVCMLPQQLIKALQVDPARRTRDETSDLSQQLCQVPFFAALPHHLRVGLTASCSYRHIRTPSP